METYEHIFTLVEQYLADKMTAEERHAFEQRRHAEPAFGEEVLRHLQARAAIREAGRTHLKRNFEAIYEEEMAQQTQSTAKVRSFSLGWRIAAGIAFLLLAGGLLWQLIKPSDPQALYAAHVTFPSTPGVRGTVPIDSAIWSQALAAYDAGQFEESAQLLDSFSKTDTFAYRSLAAFYQGLSYLHLEQSQAAVTSFRLIEKPGLYAERADWYIALAHLQAGDVEAARAALEGIVAQQGHFKAGEAEEMLGGL